MVQELLNKYIWLINLFSRAGTTGLLLEDVQREWRGRWGEEYSRRSFCNHREAISDVFGIDIVCDRSTNRYSIFGSNPSTDPLGDRAWLIDSFTVNNLLSLGRGRLAGRVSVESVPSGQKWLLTIIEAMEEDRMLEIMYRKYTAEEAETLHVRPYGLREHERRWYLVGWSLEREALRVYSLDRILQMKKDAAKFRMPQDFDIEDVFEGSYGVYRPEGRKTEKIVLRATEIEARYMRDLPLHPTQKETRPGIFELRVVPDRNLLIDLCARGAGIEVLEPLSLRQQVIEEHRKALTLYNK